MTNTDFNDLSTKRKNVLKSLFLVGDEFADRDRYADGEFTRSQLNEVFRQRDLSSVIDSNDTEGEQTLKTTTKLIEKIADEDGYLRQTQQGGDSAFVIDTEADESQGDQVTGVSEAEVSNLAFQVLNRYDIATELNHVDFNNWDEVISEVNRMVGHPVLMVKSDPHVFRWTEEGKQIVKRHL